jgi:hypothetical protein
MVWPEVTPGRGVERLPSLEKGRHYPLVGLLGATGVGRVESSQSSHYQS